MIRFFLRLLFASAIERICERISPTIRVRLVLPPGLAAAVYTSAQREGISLGEFVRRAAVEALRRAGRA